MPKIGTERKKEDMRKNNEEVTEYKNNKEKKEITHENRCIKDKGISTNEKQRTVQDNKLIATWYKAYSRIREPSEKIKTTLNDKTNLDAACVQYRSISNYYRQITHNVSFSRHY